MREKLAVQVMFTCLVGFLAVTMMGRIAQIIVDLFQRIALPLLP